MGIPEEMQLTLMPRPAHLQASVRVRLITAALEALHAAGLLARTQHLRSTNPS